MKPTTIFAIVIGGLLWLAAITWFFMANDAAQNRVFSPYNEETRRETFEQSKTYREGTVQDMYKMQIEFDKSKDVIEQKAIANLVVHRLADFPRSALPEDLRFFYAQCHDLVAQ